MGVGYLSWLGVKVADRPGAVNRKVESRLHFSDERSLRMIYIAEREVSSSSREENYKDRVLSFRFFFFFRFNIDTRFARRGRNLRPIADAV